MSDPDRTRLGAADTTEPGAGDTLDEPGAAPARTPPARRSAKFALGAVVLALAGAAAFLATRPTEALPPPPPPVVDETKAIEGLRVRARQCLDVSVESPNWDSCEAAAKSALDLNPIDPEANDLSRRLSAERPAHAALVKGTQALTFSKVEDALELLEQVPKESIYFRKAYEVAQRELEGAARDFAERCRKYAAAAKWPQAALDCGWAMRVTCAREPADSLSPPPTQVPCAQKPGKGCWIPKNELLQRLLAARFKIDPRAPPWQCPRHPLYADASAPKPTRPARPSFGDPVLDQAFAVYLKGNAGDAVNLLQRLQERTSRAEQHAAARALQRDITNVAGLVKQGQTALAQGKLEPAATAYDEALALDEKLTLGGEPSAFRKTVQAEMSDACLAAGRAALTHGDVRLACRTYKLGFRFGRGNVDLLDALGKDCTTRAAEALKSANTCADLDTVLALAVDGDGLREKAALKRQTLGCP